MPAEDVVNFLFEGTKDKQGDEEGNPKRIGWKTQIIDGDGGPDVALTLENLYNIALSAPAHCNPDKSAEMKTVMMRFPQAFQCGVDASSSRGGRLIITLMQEIKKQSMEYFERLKGKNKSSKSGFGFPDESG